MYLFITLVSLGLLYYTPQITAWLKTSFGEVPPVVVVLIPYIFGTIGSLVWGRIADQSLEGDDQRQGTAAGGELFRHRHGEPRHALFHPADHQVARQFLQHWRSGGSP
jgi:hypothetical protein